MRTAIVLLIATFAAILLAFTTPWARADEPKCYDVSAAVADAEKAGGTLLDLVDVPGDGVDQMLIVTANGAVQLMPFFEGCQAGPNKPLFLAVPPKPPPKPV